MADTSRGRFESAADSEMKFTSRFRKDKAERKERTERRTRTTVDNQNNEVGDVETTNPVRSSVNVRAAASVFNSKTETDSDRVVSRMNRLNVRGGDTTSSSSRTAKKEEKASERDEASTTTTTTEKASSSSSTNEKETTSSSNSSRKRKDRKNLREKRRSTGVVILPNMDSTANDSEEGKLKENTVQNEYAADMEVAQRGNSRGSEADALDKEDMLLQLNEYEQAILEWKDALEKANKEMDSLRQDNQRLKDENSSLLRVINQLSGGKSK